LRYDPLFLYSVMSFSPSRLWMLSIVKFRPLKAA
jgi:hypothetical protein